MRDNKRQVKPAPREQLQLLRVALRYARLKGRGEQVSPRGSGLRRRAAPRRKSLSRLILRVHLCYSACGLVRSIMNVSSTHYYNSTVVVLVLVVVVVVVVVVVESIPITRALSQLCG